MVEMGNTYPIRVEALNAGYDRTVIVQDVCLAIPPGEILALIGPNGSGKSTVLKTISGQLERIGGEIDIYGTPVQNLSREEVARNLSMVSTERPRPEMMSCREMVATGRYPYTGRLGILSEEDERITDQAIRAVHAEEIADRDFLRISDGQRQRVMLARALCQEPDILILDEPTSFLDLQYKIDILSTLRRVAKARGISVILSMHELEFVPAAADLSLIHI